MPQYESGLYLFLLMSFTLTWVSDKSAIVAEVVPCYESMASGTVYSGPGRKPCPSSTKSGKKGHKMAFGYHQDSWKTIDTVYEFPDPQTFYRDYIRKSRPLLVKGGIKDWPAVKLWRNKTYLKEQFGHEWHDMMYKRTYDRHHSVGLPMTMSNFVDNFEKERIYMDSLTSMKMLKDTRWPNYLHCEEMVRWTRQVQFFFNSGWSSTDLHLDTNEAFFAQVTGTRRWVITSPDTVRNIYTDYFPWHTGISPLNMESVDLVRFPNVSRVEVYNVTAEAGDIIFVPELWFHNVRAYGSPNIAVAFFVHFLECMEKVKSQDSPTDIDYVRLCSERRVNKPLELVCNYDYKENLPIDEAIIRYKDVHRRLYDNHMSAGEDRTLQAGTIPLQKGIDVPIIGYSVADNGDKTVHLISEALKIGYRFFDTSQNDNSEAYLGKALASHKKSDIIIMAKVHPNNLGYQATMDSVKQTLKNLKLETVDILILQAPSCDNAWFPCDKQRKTQDGTWKESWSALEDLHKDGKVKAIGVGHFSISQLQELRKIAKVAPSVVWDRMDLSDQQKELREFCSNQNMLFIAHSMLGNQIVKEGKVEKNPVFHGSLIYRQCCGARTAPTSLVLAWAQSKGVVTTFRSSKPLHLVFNWQSVGKELEDESLEELDTLESDINLAFNVSDFHYHARHQRPLPEVKLPLEPRQHTEL